MAGRDDDANPFPAPESDLESGTFKADFDEQVESASFGQRLVVVIVDNSAMTCLIGDIIQSFTGQKQVLHDFIAKTLVVMA